MEEWKDVVGWEGIYQVSNLGNIKRVDGKGKGENLKPGTDKGGYKCVHLYNHCYHKSYKVHRLVSLAFIPNPENKCDVNHINGIKADNRVENLEWATRSENIIHANKTGLRFVSDAQRRAASITGKRTCAMNRPKKKVYCVRGNFIKHFESAHAAGRWVLGCASPIIACCKGKKKQYKGYEWRYTDAN